MTRTSDLTLGRDVCGSMAGTQVDLRALGKRRGRCAHFPTEWLCVLGQQ